MGKDLMVSLDVDVEEGEISDSASVEEITAEDFDLSAKSPVIRSEVGTVKNAFVEDSKQQQQTQKVWTMNDLVKYQKKYQMSRNYAPGLYNFAWAQAVQNKPLDDYVTTNTSNTVDKHSNDDGDNNTGDTVKTDKIIVDISGDDGDSEKEEGELEEGEIDLDMEVVNAGKQGEENGIEKWVNVIRVGLEGITLNDANKSFSGVCLRLEDKLDSLSTLLLENSISNKDDLVQLAFSTIQLVYSVFSSMNQAQKELSRHIIIRMLNNVKSSMSVMLTFEQSKEVEKMFLACNSNDVSSSTKENEKEEDTLTYVNQKVSSQSEESISNAMQTETSDQNPKQTQTSTSKNRILLPLLDLHKDHDVDSLPSPTRDTTNSLPLGKPLYGSDAEIRPEWPTPTPRAVQHRYETDALKAVSTYQQKFSKSSFLFNDLPSPTPSEESGETGGDCGSEVSSFSTVQSYSNSLTSTTSAKRDIFTIPERPNVQLLANARNDAPVYSTSSAVTRVPNKTRDPRLRLANPETIPLSSKQVSVSVEPIDSRKQKTFDEPVLTDGPAPKRHKIDFSDSVNFKSTVPVSQARGLENVVTTALPSISGAGVHIPVTSVGATSASLQSILKDIAVNPTQWMNLISMEQQRSVDPANRVTQSISQSSLMGSVPMTTVVSQPLVVGNRSTTEMQIPQTASTDDLGKLRMKPRDPRRALHNKLQQKQKPEPVTKLPTIEATKVNIKQADPRVSFQPISTTHADPRVSFQPISTTQADPRVSYQPISTTQADPRVSYQPISTPDITRQFTKNLKNIADIVSTTVTASVQMPSSQPAQVHPSFVNIKGPLGSRIQNGTGPASEEVASGLGSGPAQSHNTWGDVEQFFGRFDDQQRAAIQRERSKRMEEQKKMFANRKLCLVLDLDHTLLNSAKFSEIEPVHDEMLRKKEEQDRDKPQRHLFRFPHMGMWTKLRPGIWNFLEKASKLYELHLYTMGNKLYATEMAKVLDPKGVLFNGRVISKGDDGDNADGDPKSKDLEGVLGMESSVVIIDDSIRVWPHNKLNLIVVERYIYFPCSRRQFGLPGPSLLEIDHDERPEDGTLASSLAVIEKIHQLFFLEKSLDEADVRNILASEQRKILGGCRIVFSRVFPVGEASPHLHPLWQTAEQFGAVCTNQIDEHVTHVVANSLGTDKVNWALATGRPVVHPGWVEASALLYRRANEHDFAVKP